MIDENALLVTLNQLAHEYGKKYSELDKISKDSPTGPFLLQLEQRSELTTQRFRTAQQVLLAKLPDQEKALQNATETIFRCFDEMRILLQVLLERSSNSTAS